MWLMLTVISSTAAAVALAEDACSFEPLLMSSVALATRSMPSISFDESVV